MNFIIFLPDTGKFMDKLTALLCSIGEHCTYQELYEYPNKPSYLENHVVREPCKQRTACIRNFMIFLPDIEKFMDKLTALLCSIGESCSSMLCMLQNTNAREYTKLQQCSCCSGSVAQPRTMDT